MIYSSVSIASILVCLFTNADVLLKKNHLSDRLKKASVSYRIFIYVILAFFVADALWGIFDQCKLPIALQIDTYLFFALMAASVICWTRYATFYLEKRKIVTPLILATGAVVAAFALGTIIANFFTPVLFEVGQDGAYFPKYLRYAFFTLQLTMFVATSIYAFVMSLKREGAARSRYLSMALFGIVMAVAICLQTSYPLIPFYAMGCTIGNVLVHSFVVESEKREYRTSLEIAVEKEKKQAAELAATMEKLNIDALTGAGSRTAYVNLEEELDNKIAFNKINEFAIVIFDTNGLKKINDTLGHEAGDKYLIDCYNLILSVYKDNPIYRFGGDEFVTVLQGDSYEVRKELYILFEEKVDSFKDKEEKIIVSSGMSDFNPQTDNTFKAVFVRADQKMYHRKSELKKVMGQ